MRIVVVCWTLVAAEVASAESAYEKTRIPHRDRSGRGTIVELDPGVPGARAFVTAEERPAPERGELDLPTPTPAASASAEPTPAHRY
jgi:hypothetical protein